MEKDSFCADSYRLVPTSLEAQHDWNCCDYIVPLLPGLWYETGIEAMCGYISGLFIPKIIMFRRFSPLLRKTYGLLEKSGGMPLSFIIR